MTSRFNIYISSKLRVLTFAFQRLAFSDALHDKLSAIERGVPALPFVQL